MALTVATSPTLRPCLSSGTVTDVFSLQLRVLVEVACALRLLLGVSLQLLAQLLSAIPSTQSSRSRLGDVVTHLCPGLSDVVMTVLDSD